MVPDHHPFMRSFTIVVTDNDTGASYDHTIMVDRAVSPEMLGMMFNEALTKMAMGHAQGGICPGQEEPDAD